MKTTEQEGPRGYDGAKQVNGRKRHPLVDSERLVLEANVLSADLHDQQGGREFLEHAHGQIRSRRHLFADSTYRGHSARWAKGIRAFKVL